MNKDKGASGKPDRATHEQRPLAGSAVPVGIPSAVLPDWRRVMPRYWFQNYPTDRHWDVELRSLIAGATDVHLDDYTVVIDGVSIWIANWPYGFGYLMHTPEAARTLPTVSTRLLLRASLTKWAQELWLRQARDSECAPTPEGQSS